MDWVFFMQLYALLFFFLKKKKKKNDLHPTILEGETKMLTDA